MKRYGLIGTCYNMGISNIAWGFAEQLDMKTLLVDNKPFSKFPDRFKDKIIVSEITEEAIGWLLKDIEVLMAIETPYHWPIFKMARDRGIKVVFMPMVEWLDRKRTELQYVDLFVCPSSATFRTMEALYPGKCVEVPCEVPIDRSKFTNYQDRNVEKARIFLHNGGHGGIGGRNSTRELMQAIPLVRSPAKFIIRSQYPLTGKTDDPRVTYVEANIENYWDLYGQGDCWIMPWKYGVAALGLQESMAAGMLPVITNMEPFNEFMPQGLLIEPEKVVLKVHHAGQKELYARQSPTLIAKKIDELYDMDIRLLSHWAKKTAKAWSWDVWKPKYIALFDAL